MDTDAMWGAALDELGLSATEFMKAIGGDDSTFSNWRRGVSNPRREFERKIRDVHNLRLLRDGHGTVIDIQKVSASDTDDSDDLAEIGAARYSGTLTDEDMIEQYDAIARRMQLPRWEDLQDDVREGVKGRIRYLENQVIVARAAAENAIHDMVRKAVAP